MGNQGKGGGSVGKDQAVLNKKLFEESSPLRRQLMGDIMEATSTGGVGARIPQIQRAVESANSATSDANRQLGEGLSTAGLADTPWGQRAMSQQNLGGLNQAAQIPNQIAQQLTAMGPNFALGLPQIANTGMAQGAGSMNTAKGNQITALDDIAKNTLSTAQMMFGGGAACWVAEELFGKYAYKTGYARDWVETHDNVFTRMYTTYGREWAETVRDHCWARAIAWPIWSVLAELGKR